MTTKSTQPLTQAHEDEYRIIVQNDSAIALHNYTPIMDYHAIVIPKSNTKYLAELTAKEAKDILDLIQTTSAAISSCAKCDVIVLKNEGNHATYPEKLHFHIIPSQYKFGELYLKVSTNDLQATNRDRTIRSKENLQDLTNEIKKFL
jgi:diadenosine tetraphosphate (Ap4A) HIT family hydrolase